MKWGTCQSPAVTGSHMYYSLLLAPLWHIQDAAKNKTDQWCHDVMHVDIGCCCSRSSMKAQKHCSSIKWCAYLHKTSVTPRCHDGRLLWHAAQPVYATMVRDLGGVYLRGGIKIIVIAHVIITVIVCLAAMPALIDLR